MVLLGRRKHWLPRPATNAGFSRPQARAASPHGLRLLVAVTAPISMVLLRGQLAAARAAGFAVTALSARGTEAQQIAEAEGVRHIGVDMERAIAPGRDLVSLAALIRVLRAERPHIVNAGTPKAGLLVTMAARIAGVPCCIYTLHGLRAETLRGMRRQALLMATRLSCRLADEVICISPSLRQSAQAHGVLSMDKAVVLGAGSSNGIDLVRFRITDKGREQARRLRRRLKIAQDAPVLGFVGRLAQDKGLRELAAAWSALRQRHPTLHLVLVGPPEPTDPVPESIMSSWSSDARVHQLGYVEDIVPTYLAMDLLALPTYREGFGNVLIEAAALSLAVVATQVTGCVDAVVDGETGTLVPARDAAALGAAIDAYLCDPARRARHGRAGRARAERDFCQQQIWARLHQRYIALAQRKGLIGEATQVRV